MLLVRHGSTESNLSDPPRLQGRGVDQPLSAEGRQQAESTARRLQQVPLDAVYASPLRRAQETAQHIARPHELPTRTLNGVAEVDVGSWERRTWQEIMRDEPDAYRRFVEDPGNHGYADGENLSQVCERTLHDLSETAQRHLHQTIAVVAHNVVNRVFLAYILNLPFTAARGLSQDNCGINILRFRDGEWKLISMNSILHLSANNNHAP